LSAIIFMLVGWLRSVLAHRACAALLLSAAYAAARPSCFLQRVFFFSVFGAAGACATARGRHKGAPVGGRDS